jgi:phosphatidate phosphatase APP1
MAISVKVFDAEKNPQAKFEQGEGVLENVFVNVTITNQFDKYVTSFNGKTDSNGLFHGSYVVRENIDSPGKYNVNVTVDDGDMSISQSFTTFFRGDIRDYFNNPP